MVRQVQLTKGKIALVDDKDYGRVMTRRWTAYLNGKNWYCHASIDGKQVPLHRFILNASPGVTIDHRDHDGLNNQRQNLRPCTTQQNLMNSGPRNGTSKFKGVAFCKRTGKWQAAMCHNGKTLFLGRHEKEEDAAAAYNRKALELFSDFAWLNPL